MAEAAAEARRLRKKYAPKFKSVAPGIRTNPASKARERFIARLANV